jgi:hypothetical protein
MIQKLLLILIFVCSVSTSFGQKSRKSLFSPSKFGIQFTQGNEQNFLFDDPDYFYRTNTLKLQFFYPLTQWKKLNISLIIQPQAQFIQHQLHNEQFVLPDEENYLEKRDHYTKLKNLSITALEFTLDVKRQLFKNTHVFLQFGLGFANIDTSTERLVKGFTFLENTNIGLECSINAKTSIRLFSGLGHISNLNVQLPNAGYDILNTGIGIQYHTK